jgi:hypothetical protein
MEGEGSPVIDIVGDTSVDISYATPQAHEIVNVALHRKYSPGIVFTFSQ